MATVEQVEIATLEHVDWYHYLGHDVRAAALAKAAPALAETHAGLPPSVIAVAGFDPLRDDGIAYAGHLLQADVPTTLRIYDSLIHPFFSMPHIPAVAEQAVVDITHAFAAAIAAPRG